MLTSVTQQNIRLSFNDAYQDFLVFGQKGILAVFNSMNGAELEQTIAGGERYFSTTVINAETILLSIGLSTRVHIISNNDFDAQLQA